ncbi:hypothetical protein [Bradyrhizobium japonicum]|uniref:hypothetical protein n=1 Tax=Bradyrhizobium japonicum TaxID=375 RepID=UPI00271480C4|nr:hypothetical protein [Bradyrhizobium japonicum]WLB24099.1 hypothetical protein QIH95_50135 [Bradyrhizobium japonicum]
MKKDLAIRCLLAATMATSAFAATTVLTAAPGGSRRSDQNFAANQVARMSTC